jgi:hypothetical protein
MPQRVPRPVLSVKPGVFRKTASFNEFYKKPANDDFLFVRALNTFMYEDIKNEIERRILELMSLAGEAAVAEKLTIPDIGELTFVDEENLHITPKGAVMRGWDDWHMVREFVQNSLDAVGKVDMVKIGDTLIISDLGAGFDVDAFIIGGTTKDPFCSRGRFGEGMKYAICVALNKGYDLTIIQEIT